MSGFQNIEVAPNQIDLLHRTKLDFSGLIPSIESNDEHTSVFEVFRESLQDLQDLPVRNVVHRLPKWDYVELLRWAIAQEVRVDKAVFAGPTAFPGALHSLCQSSFGNVDADITLIDLCGEFIRGVARATAKIQDIPIVRVLF